MAKTITLEEKAARKIEELVSDNRLDLYLVGMYLSQTVRRHNYNRIKAITESLDRELGKQ
jgi:hypothetical protein